MVKGHAMMMKYIAQKRLTGVTTARLNVKSRSHHDTAHLHPHSMSPPCLNFLHIMVSDIQPGQDLAPAHSMTQPDAIAFRVCNYLA